MKNKKTPRSKSAALVLCVLAAAWSMPATAGASARAASARRASRPIVLGADNLVTGSTSAVATVTIPKDATYPALTGENPYFQLSGRGRFIGVFLVQVGGLESDGISLFVGRYSFCGAPGCKPTDMQQFMIKRGTPDGSRDGEGLLPAGEYRLILLTDGAPATARLRFDGLHGKSKITPKTPIESSVTQPEAVVTAPGKVAYADGGALDFSGIKGLTFNVLRIEGDTWLARRYGNCIYRGDPPLPPQLAYTTPECPGGLSFATFEAGAQTSPFSMDTYAQTIFDPGRWGFGTFYQTAGLITEGGALVVSADLPPAAG